MLTTHGSIGRIKRENRPWPSCAFTKADSVLDDALLVCMKYGVYAVTYIDIPSQCEKTYHLKRFVTFSITFNSIGFFTYLVFSWLVKRNDRESARARAMALIVIHLAFSVWGSLTWQKLMNSNCEDDLDLDMKIAHEGSIAFNGV
jgi:hypothetical protein